MPSCVFGVLRARSGTSKSVRNIFRSDGQNSTLDHRRAAAEGVVRGLRHTVRREAEGLQRQRVARHGAASGSRSHGRAGRSPRDHATTRAGVGVAGEAPQTGSLLVQHCRWWVWGSVVGGRWTYPPSAFSTPAGKRGFLRIWPGSASRESRLNPPGHSAGTAWLDRQGHTSRIEHSLKDGGRADLHVVVGDDEQTIEVQLSSMSEAEWVRRDALYRSQVSVVTWLYGLEADARALPEMTERNVALDVKAELGPKGSTVQIGTRSVTTLEWAELG